MHPAVIAILIVFSFGMLWLIRRRAGGEHARFVTESHLAEMLEIVAALKRAALQHMEEAGQESAMLHPDCMRTSAEGIRVVYSITHQETGYVHHCSLQTAGGPTPAPVGEMLMLFICTSLGFPEGRVAFERSHRGVYHAEITLSEAEHAAFIEHAPPARVYPE